MRIKKILPEAKQCNLECASCLYLFLLASIKLRGFVRTTTRGSNGPQNVTQLTNDHPSRMKVMLQ
jgi:hypothetical protein